ncbi:hypothetical protein J7K43_01100 [Candidatus Calescamantes bacterium]|nr:hypothetical protein [Candidatus Calescamantes bacterium]
MEDIDIVFEFEVTGYDVEREIKVGNRTIVRKRHVNQGSIRSGDFTISEFKITNRGYTKEENYILQKAEEFLLPYVADLFNMDEAHFKEAITSLNTPVGLVGKSMLQRFAHQVLSNSVYKVLLDIAFIRKNMALISRMRDEYPQKDRRVGFVYEDAFDRDVLKQFQKLLVTELEKQFPGVEGTELIWDALTKLDSRTWQTLAENIWRQLGPQIQEPPQYVHPQEFATAEEVRLRILPKVLAFLDRNEPCSRGSAFYATLSWLSLKLYDEYKRAGLFSREEERRMQDQIEADVKLAKERYELEEVSRSWRERIEDNVHRSFAMMKAIEEMREAGRPLDSVDDYIEWITKSFIPEEYVNNDSLLYNAIVFASLYPQELREVLSQVPEEQLGEVNLSDLIDEITDSGKITPSEAQRIKEKIGAERRDFRLSETDIQILKEYEKWYEALSVFENLLKHYDQDTVRKIIYVRYTKDDVWEIERQLNAFVTVKPWVSKVMGPPVLIYQDKMRGKSLTEFFNSTIFEPDKRYLLTIYDPRTGLFLDNPGASDASLAATALALAYLAGLYKEGIITDEDVEPIRRINGSIRSVHDMVELTLKSLISIQERQPKGEWIDALLRIYPLGLVEKLASLPDEKLQELKDPQRWTEWVTAEWINPMVISNKDVISALTENHLNDELIGYIKQIGENDIENIKKYGFGGWFYHFVNLIDLSRSKPDVELTSVDTVLTALSAYLASLVFPDLKDLALQVVQNIEMDGLFSESFDKKAGQNRYYMAWTPNPEHPAFEGYDYRGFTPSEWVYRAHEELAFHFVKALWEVLRNNGQAVDLGKEFYLARDKSKRSNYGLPSFYPSINGTSWTFSLLPVDLRGKDTFGDDWYFQSILGILYNRIASLRTGLYGPYNSIVGSQELPPESIKQSAYEMSQGIGKERITDRLYNSGDEPTVEADGTFSIYSLNFAALPAESYLMFLHQWITNPRLWGGIFGPHGGFNRKMNFWSATYYTFDKATFGLNALNGFFDTFWSLCRNDDLMQKVYESLGISFEPDKYYKTASDLIPEYKTLNDLVKSKESEYQQATDTQRLQLGYEIAEARVKQVVRLLQGMRGIDKDGDGKISNEELYLRRYAPNLFREFLKVGDRYYDEALSYLPAVEVIEDPELKAKVMALRFVILKNRPWYEGYEAQKEAFKELTNFLKIHPEQALTACEVIKQFDYEASVMWKSWDISGRKYVPVLSEEQILADLQNPGERPRTACYPELEEYLSKPWQPYTLFPEDVGVIAPYVYGTDKTKGLLQLAEEKGWDEAVRIMNEEFTIQAALRPYIEDILLKRRLDLANPDGKDAGFLTSWAAKVRGGLEEKKSGPGWGWVCVIDDTKDWRNNGKDIRWFIAFERRMIETSWWRFGEKFDPVYGTNEQLKRWHDLASIAQSRSHVFGHWVYYRPEGSPITILKGEHAMAGSEFGFFKYEAPVVALGVREEGNATATLEDGRLDIKYTLGPNNPVVRIEIPVFNKDFFTYTHIGFDLSRKGSGPGSMKLIIRNKQGEEVVWRINNLDDARKIILPIYGSSPAYRWTKDWRNHLRRYGIEFLGDVVTDWIQDWGNIESIVLEMEAESPGDYGEGELTLSFNNAWVMERIENVTQTIDTTVEKVQELGLPSLVFYDKGWQMLTRIRRRGQSYVLTLKDEDGRQQNITWDDFVKSWNGKIRTISNIQLPVLVNYNNEWLLVKEITNKGFVKYVRIMSGRNEEMKIDDFLFGWNGEIIKVK